MKFLLFLISVPKNHASSHELTAVSIHTYMCSCPDSFVLNNMCKHIHLVQTKLAGETRVENEEIHGMSADQEYVNKELSTIAAKN